MKKILCLLMCLMCTSLYALDFSDAVYKCTYLYSVVGKMKYDDHYIQIRGNQFMVLNSKGVVIQKIILDDSRWKQEDEVIYYKGRLKDTGEEVVVMAGFTDQEKKDEWSFTIFYNYGKENEKWETFGLE